MIVTALGFLVAAMVSGYIGYRFGERVTEKLERVKGAAAREVNSDLRLMATMTDEEFAKLRARYQLLCAAARKDL